MQPVVKFILAPLLLSCMKGSWSESMGVCPTLPVAGAGEEGHAGGRPCLLVDH